MMRIKAIILLLVVMFPFVTYSENNRQQSVGLVLSGGGAKGIAHIGVIKALEENNIPIDYITGTSMGAIVGGLYAAGYTPEEMMELIKSPGFANWSTGQIDQKLTYYFAKNAPTPEFVSVNLGEKKKSKVNSLLPQGLINPLPMNFAFMELFAGHTAQCDGNFDNLFVPFRCVASDVTHKRKIVCRDGDLGDAIRASMTFPVVFHPIKMNGVWVYDGGIYDNFPVDVMRSDFAPSIMIGVNVSSEKASHSNDVVDQLESMIMQGNITPITEEEGIYIDLDLDQFGLLDFPKAQDIYDIGYSKAMGIMNTISHRVTARVSSQSVDLKRAVFKSKTPHIMFDSVNVTGGTPDENEYIQHVFMSQADTFSVKQAKDAYYSIITPGKLKNLVPKAIYDNQDGLFTLDMEASVKDNYRLAFGGYISSSTNSMLFLSGGYNTMSFNSVDMNLNAWIGQSYMAGELNSRMYLRTSFPSYLKLQAVVSRYKFYESENLFYEENLPTFISNTEAYARLNYSVGVGRRGMFEIGAGYGYLQDDYYQSNVIDFSDGERDKSYYNLGQAFARYEYNSLNDKVYPTEGDYYRLNAMGLVGDYNYKSHDGINRTSNNVYWGQLEFNAKNYFSLTRKFKVGTELNVLASTKKLLSNYYASIVQAPAFAPTASSYNAFNPAFRANSYATLGLKPIWRVSSTLQLRGEFHTFMPFRKIKENTIDFTPYYGKWFANPEFLGEVSVVFRLPFASLSAYGNYMSYPARNWGFGLSFGLFFMAPKFIN